MRPDLEQYYLIDQYLENKLQDRELEAFENQIKTNPTLVNQVQEQQMLNSFILEAELKNVRIQLEKDLARLNNPSFFRTYWKWISVSSLFLLGILFYTFTPTNKEKSTIYFEQKKHIEQRIELTPAETLISTSKKTVATKNNTVITSSNISHQSTDKIIEAPVQQQNILEPSVQQQNILEPSVQQQNTIANSVESAFLETKESVDTKKIDCSSVKISFTLKPQATCQDEQEGIVDIESIHGGVSPYTFLIDNKKVKERKIINLGAGIYEIKIMDKNGCASDQKTTISEKNCVVAVEQQNKFNINPAIGEVCKISTNPNKISNLTIYNRSGKIIYRITNNSNDLIEWNGSDGYGSIVEQGLYVYIVEYSDGTKESGEVNIVR